MDHPQVRLKRKHQSLSIQEKVEMLKELDLGISVRKLCDTYGIGSSTVYDIKKQKEKIMKFYEASESKKQMSIRKTMKDGKSTEHDRMMMKWFRKRRSDGLDLTGNMIKDQAKLLHKELELDHKCDYSEGWLQRFKKRHGIVLQKNGEKLSGNPEEEISANNVDDFAMLVKEKHPNTDQVFNTSEISGETAPAPKNKPSSIPTVTTDAEEEPDLSTKSHPSKKTKKGKGGTQSEFTRTSNHGNKPVMKGKCKLKGDNKAGDVNGQKNNSDVAPVFLYRHTDGEIIDIILKSNKKNKGSGEVYVENESEEENETFSIDILIELLGDLIKGLEQRSFVTEEEILHFYLMYEKLERERSKRIQKLRLHEMFKKISQRFVYREPNSKQTNSFENPVASTSAIPEEDSLFEKLSTQEETNN